MNLPTLIVSLILLAGIVLIIRNMVKLRKAGKCAGCPYANRDGSGCDHCKPTDQTPS